MIPWLILKCHISHYNLNFVRLPWDIHQYWNSIQFVPKILFCLSAFCSSGVLILLGYRYFTWRQIQIQMLIEADLMEEKVISYRRRKGFPPGLVNERNSCYANCILQAISPSEHFVKWLQLAKVQNESNAYSLLPSVSCLMKVLTNKTGNEDVYSATDVFHSLRSHGWMISPEQHDSYEFFQILLSTIEEEVIKSCSLKEKPSLFLPNTIDVGNMVSLSLQVGQRLSSHPFKGSLASKMVCTCCLTQLPIKFENFDSISFSLQSIPQVNASLYSCFDTWHILEFLHGVSCENCSSKTTFTRQSSFAKLPQCLCVHLQRSSYANNGSVTKFTMHIRFPEMLDLKQYTFAATRKCSRNKESSILKQNQNKADSRHWYKLCAVVLHYGSSTNGHFAVFRRFDASRWVYISDCTVREVSLRQVLDSSAYMLFYDHVTS